MECINHTQRGDRDGYGKTVRHINGERKYIRLHRAIFFDTHKYWPEVVRHTCDNPRCINPAHLLAGTVLDNNRDRALRKRNGDLNGQDNGAAKLSDAQVVEIKRLAATTTRQALASQYNVNIRHIFRILKGERRDER